MRNYFIQKRVWQPFWWNFDGHSKKVFTIDTQIFVVSSREERDGYEYTTTTTTTTTTTNTNKRNSNVFLNFQ
mgnify:FL=1